MNIDVNTFRVREGNEVDLGLWATHTRPACKSKKVYRKLLQDHVEALSDQQRLLYASNHHALLHDERSCSAQRSLAHRLWAGSGIAWALCQAD